ncbi:MAG: class I SAM-dependent methyltransferase [Sedimentisphaerales bacterium]|nr:class I SAM-dependent methyltransferase [Sedimentisphaerales bacterium]
MTRTILRQTSRTNSSTAMRWERPVCNLCGRDDAALFHRERLPYFGRWMTFSIVKCRYCGLIYTYPRPADHNATYLADEVTAAALEAHGRAKQGVFERVLQRIALLRQHEYRSKEQSKLLDMGCGSGHFLNIARECGYEVTGIEPASGPARYARERFGLNVLQAPANACDLPENSFDVVTAWDVIEHVADPRGMMALAARWLKPNGVMALRFPAGNWHKFKARLLHDCLQWRRPVFSPTMHYTFFDEDTFLKMAHRTGLSVQSFHTTSAEANTDNMMLNVLKVAADMGLRRLEGLIGRRMGNLEAYCLKIP